jgi:hypothetical protein
MSKQSKNDTGFGGIITLLVMGIFIALKFLFSLFITILLTIFPVTLLFTFVVFELRRSRRSTELLQKDKERLGKLEWLASRIYDRLERIEEEGSHLKKNADASYHRGSKLGSRLNGEIERITPQFDAAILKIRDIRSQPIRNFNYNMKMESMRHALRVAMLLYVSTFGVVYFIDSINSRLLIDLGRESSLVNVSELGDNYYSAGIASASASATALGLVYLCGLLVRRQNAERLSLVEFGEPILHTIDEDDEVDEEINKNEETQTEEEIQEPWYKILDIEPDANKSEIINAWRMKIKINHPDLVAGLDIDFQALAENKAKKINAARQAGLDQLE